MRQVKGQLLNVGGKDEQKTRNNLIDFWIRS